MTINEAIKWYKDKETEYKYLSKEYKDFAMMAEQYHQFVEWLTELKDLREENKVLTSECDRLIKEKGELLSKVSGGDVLKICQLEEQLEKAKQLLKAAVEQMSEVGDVCDCIHSQNCPLDECGKFTFNDEIMKFISN